MSRVQQLNELRQKEDKELDFECRTLSKELFELRFKSSSEGIAKPSRIRQIRRDIARIKTILRERHLGVRGQTPRT